MLALLLLHERVRLEEPGINPTSQLRQDRGRPSASVIADNPWKRFADESKSHRFARDARRLSASDGGSNMRSRLREAIRFAFNFRALPQLCLAHDVAVDHLLCYNITFDP